MLKKTLGLLAISAIALTLFLPAGHASMLELMNPASVPSIKLHKQQAIIYQERVSEVLVNNRMWPTINLWQKIGKNDPEFLVQVGKVGEFPLHTVLSPDKKSLLINLESKLQLLDLETKQLTNLFIPMKQVESAAFSTDGKKVLVWDQIYASEDYEYYVHVVDLDTKTSTTVKHGNTEGKYFFIKVWRDDNIVILSQAMGEAAKLWMFDLSTSELTEASHLSTEPYLSASFSRKGSYLALLDTIVSDDCNDFWRMAYSTYNIYDPLSGEILRSLGDPKKATDLIGFSRNEQAVLYRTYTPWDDQAKCGQEPTYQYHLLWIGSGEIVPISNPKPLYALMEIPAFEVDLDPKYWVRVKYFLP